ncbi:MFS transporter [Rhodococcus sp. 1168]|uniref:MFS transporter n=1 Tax=Rhodococcus sp. 1168 TaxID=2018041 RepID=UPI001C393406|nr:MFS transporter [Rhodococcus sp. 1168]
MTTSTSPTDRAVTMSGRQISALIVLLASQFMMAADFSVLNVALPRVGDDLGFTSGNLQWITTTFALCAAGCTLVFGRLGDVIGRRRIFIGGMVLLCVASVIGGLAESPSLLLLARTLQGLATAAVTPAALALLTTTFSDPALRTRALGLNGVMMSLGFTVGAVLGGVLTDLLSWRWAFFINIPVAVAAIVIVPIVVNESRSGSSQKLDVPGAALITAGLFAVIYGVTTGAESGFSGIALLALAAGLGLLGVFSIVESRSADALVPVQILKKRTVAVSNVAALFIFGGETALIFFTGLYVQNVLGLSPLAAGLTLLGIGLGQIVGGFIGPRVLTKVAPRTALGASLALQGLLMAPMVWTGTDSIALIPLLATQFVNGIFSMLAMLSFMVIATSSVTDDLQGMATGMATQSQQVGIAVGIPLMSAIFTAVAGADALGVEQLDGIRVAVGIDAVLLVVVGVAAWLALRIRASSIGTEPSPATA